MGFGGLGKESLGKIHFGSECCGPGTCPSTQGCILGLEISLVSSPLGWEGEPTLLEERGSVSISRGRVAHLLPGTAKGTEAFTPSLAWELPFGV